MKQINKKEYLLSPCPTLLVTSKFKSIENVLTVSWAGISCSHPEYVTISINPKRFSYSLIKKSKRFCINIPDEHLIQEVDFCGNTSGKKVDKFKECNFTKEYIDNYILIGECSVSVLCEVYKTIELGSHTLFISRVIAKYIDPKVIKNNTCIINPISYCRPYYYGLGDCLGCFGNINNENSNCK